MGNLFILASVLEAPAQLYANLVFFQLLILIFPTWLEVPLKSVEMSWADLLFTL